jgi:hypothetical protein
MILAQQKRTPEIKLLATPHEDKAGDADEWWSHWKCSD